MRQIIKLFAILAIAVVVSSCMDEDEVCYRFNVCNITDTEMKVHLSSWGEYAIIVNGTGKADKKLFLETETINPRSALEFVKVVDGDPNPYEVPSSLTPVWEYVTAIECDGVTIPKEYINNQENWDLNASFQINGTATYIYLDITPELIEQYRKTN